MNSKEVRTAAQAIMKILKGLVEKCEESEKRAGKQIEESPVERWGPSPWTPRGMSDATFIEKLLKANMKFEKMLGWTRRSTFPSLFGMSALSYTQFCVGHGGAEEEIKNGNAVVVEEVPEAKITKEDQEEESVSEEPKSDQDQEEANEEEKVDGSPKATVRKRRRRPAKGVALKRSRKSGSSKRV